MSDVVVGSTLGAPPPLDADLAAMLAELQAIADSSKDEHVKVCARQAMLMVYSTQENRFSRVATLEQLEILRQYAARELLPVQHPTPMERIAEAVEKIEAKLSGTPTDPAPPPPAPPPVPNPSDPPAPSPVPVPAPAPPPIGVDQALLQQVVLALAPSTFGAEKLRERTQEVLDVIAWFGSPAPVQGPVPPPPSGPLDWGAR